MDNDNIASQLRTMLADAQAPVTRQWLADAQARYPYFTLPALLYLRRNGVQPTGDDSQLLTNLAIATSDRRSLALVLGPAAQRWANFYPPEPEPETPDTDTTITQFLDSYGHSNPKEIEALSNAIFNPTPDYADILAREDQEERKKRRGAEPTPEDQDLDDQLINKYIEQSRQRELQAEPATVAPPAVAPEQQAEIAATPIAAPKAQDHGMLSESLAKMHISRRNYSKALEIIENINLKFPEKSIYFADQIRFLRKLVANEQAQRQR